MKTKLTEKLLKSISPAEKPFELIDDTLPGFLVRVQPSGCMTFYLSYRTSEGTRKRIKLGKYGPVTLVQAKELAKRHAGSVANGDDPQADKQAIAQQSKKAEVETLNGFIAAHYRPWVKKNRKSGDHTLMVLDKYFSSWGSLLMLDITKQRVEKWRLQELHRGLKPATVNRILNALRSVLTQAVELGLLENSPLGRLKKLAEYDDKRIRYLTFSARIIL